MQRYIDYFPHKSCLLAISKIEKVKTLCNVVEEAPDNVAQEKILINVGAKKVILFPEITLVKMFLSFIHPHSRVCIRIYIFNLKKKTTTRKQKKTRRQKQAKESKAEQISVENLTGYDDRWYGLRICSVYF